MDMKVEFMITARLNERMAESEDMARAINTAVARFVRKDWGEVPDEDKQYNDEDLKNRDGHVLARYETPEDDIYINLSFDEVAPGSNTALIMFCNEY